MRANVLRWGSPTVLALVLSLAACSSGGGSDVSYCDAVVEAAEAGLLDDDLLDPTAGPRALEVRLTGALRAGGAAADLTPTTDSDAWTSVLGSLESVRDRMAGADWDLIAVVGDPGGAEALAALAEPDLTEARQTLASAVGDCGGPEVRPTAGLAVVVAEREAQAPIDLRSVDPASLSPAELAGVLARQLSLAELDLLLRQAQVADVGELAELLLAGRLPEGEAILERLAGRLNVSSYGDDETLDGVWDRCRAGGGEACDLLVYLAPEGSEYERFGSTCGERVSSGPCGEVELR